MSYFLVIYCYVIDFHVPRRPLVVHTRFNLDETLPSLHLQIEPYRLRILLTKAMEVVAKERLMVVPVKPIKKHRLFLSNVDLTLVAYYETVAFFKPLKARKLSLLEAFERLRVGLGEILVAYDFVAGRLSPSKEGDRLEIDCNGAGVVLVGATACGLLDCLDNLRAPKAEFDVVVVEKT
ncbi:hypothetical protein AMTRI_Chr06g195740 [Amborella trichopoda]